VILTAHQTAYLPWGGLINKILQADAFCNFNAVRFSPKAFENRNYIKGANGKILLTVPVKGGRDQLIKDVEIVDSNWRSKHAKSIQLAYCKKPYFKEYWPFFEDVYSRKWQLLDELNEYILKHLLHVLNINVTYYKASNYNFKGLKSDLVLDMCKVLKSDCYIFGGEGKNYCDIEAFEKAGVKPIFQEYQDKNDNLSVIDLLFNHGDRSLEILKN